MRNLSPAFHVFLQKFNVLAGSGTGSRFGAFFVPEPADIFRHDAPFTNYTIKFARAVTETTILATASRLPSFSHCPESLGEDGQVGEHIGEFLDQWQQARLRHGGDEFV